MKPWKLLVMSSIAWWKINRARVAWKTVRYRRFAGRPRKGKCSSVWFVQRNCTVSSWSRSLPLPAPAANSWNKVRVKDSTSSLSDQCLRLFPTLLTIRFTTSDWSPSPSSSSMTCCLEARPSLEMPDMTTWSGMARELCESKRYVFRKFWKKKRMASSRRSSHLAAPLDVSRRTPTPCASRKARWARVASMLSSPSGEDTFQLTPPTTAPMM
mmetsp:Transcript_65/g.213  ORF Transcript_65/g.213 Transcript_65/m.213 type:complete len:212 (+) Transcript_65:1505-2140(+)